MVRGCLFSPGCTSVFRRHLLQTHLRFLGLFLSPPVPPTSDHLSVHPPYPFIIATIPAHQIPTVSSGFPFILCFPFFFSSSAPLSYPSCSCAVACLLAHLLSFVSAYLPPAPASCNRLPRATPPPPSLTHPSIHHRHPPSHPPTFFTPFSSITGGLQHLFFFLFSCSWDRACMHSSIENIYTNHTFPRQKKKTIGKLHFSNPL